MQSWLVSLFVLCFIVFISTVHKIDEGYVGVYWRGGALMNKITEPGLNFKLPFIDSFEMVQITVQTDKVTNIPCGTSGGVLIWIERVEVVNRLKKKDVYQTVKNYTTNYDKIWIFDKIHHEINQFCSKNTLQEVYIDLFHTVDDRLVSALQAGCDQWAPGIEIIAIRITKPKIPFDILRNYELMEAEKTKFLIANEAQKVVEKEAETDRKKAIIEGEKLAAVSKIKMEQEILEKEGQKEIAAIGDEIHLHHEKVLADADYYRLETESQVYSQLLTPKYLQLQAIEALSSNVKVYFGSAINSLTQIIDQFTSNKQ